MRATTEFRTKGTWARAFAIGMALCSLTSCARVYIDDNGLRHVTGFVHLTFPAPDADAIGGHGVRVATIGLSWLTSDVATSLAIGYVEDQVVILRNHSCVNASFVFQSF